MPPFKAQSSRTREAIEQLGCVRPLRFCLISTFYPPYHYGGDAVFVHRLANELSRRGHHVEVIHCLDSYYALGGGPPRQTFENHPNVTVHSLKSRWGFLSPLSTLLTGIPFFKRTRIRQILAKGFDVIHYHNISLVGGARLLEYGAEVAPASRRERGAGGTPALPIKLYTPHEYWLVCPTHMLFRFNREPCRRRTCTACSLVHGRPPQWWRYSGMLRRAVQHVDAFLSLTEFVETIHRREGLELPFVRLPFFLPNQGAAAGTEEKRRADSPRYFLYVGRLEKLKGVQTLIPLFRRYSKAQLWIAGSGNYAPRLRRMASGSANIRFLGPLPFSELSSLYANALGVIVPSLFYEISPLVIVEAAWHKTPVIARNLGGCGQLVADLGAGFVYDTETDLVAALDRLCSEPGLREELGWRGHAACQEKYSAEAHVSRYLDLILALAAQREVLLGQQ